jgi:hypothetical protein
VAAPSFDEWAAYAKSAVPDATDDRIRAEYQRRYNATPVRTQGPDRDTWRSWARQNAPDVTDDAIDAEYDRRYGAPALTSLSRTVKRGAGGLTSWLGDMGNVLPSLFGSQPAAAAVAGLSEAGEGYARRNAMSAEMANAPWYSPEKVLNQTLEAGIGMLPQLASGSAPVGATIGATQEAMPFYRELRESGVPAGEAAARAGLFGGYVGLTGFLPLNRIFGRAPGRLVTGALEATTEISEGGVQAALTPGKGLADIGPALLAEAEGVGAPAFLLGSLLGATGRAGPRGPGTSEDREELLRRAREAQGEAAAAAAQPQAPADIAGVGAPVQPDGTIPGQADPRSGVIFRGPPPPPEPAGVTGVLQATPPGTAPQRQPAPAVRIDPESGVRYPPGFDGVLVTNPNAPGLAGAPPAAPEAVPPPPTRRPDETDPVWQARLKAYAKRYIDTQPAPDPATLPRQSAAYFDAPEGAWREPLDALVTTKGPEDKGATKALTRFRAAAQGILPKRAPVDVEFTEDRKLRVLDGNGTVNALRTVGLEDGVPVRVARVAVPGEFAADERRLTDEQRAGVVREFRRAEQDLPVYEQFLNELTGSLFGDNGRVQMGPIKGIGRTTQKVALDYKGDASRMKDVLRSTVLVESPQELEALVAGLAQQGQVTVLPGERNTLAANQPGEDGYMDYKVNVQLPSGGTYEIQAMPRAAYDIKNGIGHDLLEARRKIEARAVREGRLPTEAEAAEIRTLMEQSRAAYAPGYSRFFGASGTPDRVTLEAATGRNEPSDSATTAATPSGDTQARSPSQSQGRQSGPGRTELPIRFSTGSIVRHQQVTTPAGRTLRVEPQVVEADQLITSDAAEYPAAMQPRDRSRQASRAQVEGIASKLQPELLGLTPSAADGAPIVAPTGVVESGNGRVMALRRAMAAYPERYQAYRDWLAGQGFDVAGMRAPVLVRVRAEDLPESELQQFAVEANQRTNLGMSATEQAAVDARLLNEQLLGVLEDGELTAAANAPFVRGFLGRLPASEQANLIGADGRIAAEGIRRMKAAIIARAYGGSEEAQATINRMLESTDDDVRSITNALTRVAPLYARLRQAIDDGVVPAQFDIASAIATATENVSKVRQARQSPAEFLAQQDMFAADQAPMVVYRLMHSPDLKRAASAERIVEALTHYATQALEQRSDQGALFGGDEVAPADILAQTVDIFHGGHRFGEDAQAARPAGAGMSERALRDMVGTITGGWTNGPRIVIASNAGALPTRVLRSLGPDIEGAYEPSTGTVYMVASNIGGPWRAQEVLAHEAIGHYGMERLFGARWPALLADVARLAERDPIVRRLWRSVEAEYSMDGQPPSPRVMAAETIARLAELSPKHPLTAKVLTWFREALRRLGFRINLSRTDLVGYLHQAARGLSGEASATTSSGEFVSFAARPPDDVSFYGMDSAGLERELELARAERDAAKAAGDQRGARAWQDRARAIANFRGKLRSAADRRSEQRERDVQRRAEAEAAAAAQRAQLDNLGRPLPPAMQGVDLFAQGAGAQTGPTIEQQAQATEAAGFNLEPMEGPPRQSQRDLFAARRRVAAGDIGAPGATMDLFAAPTLPAPAIRSLFVDQAAGKSTLRPTGVFRHGLETVKDSLDAARLVASLRKSAVEQMLAVVVDSTKRPIAVLRNSIGAIDQAGVYFAEMAKSLALIPGAAGFHMVHNHPSGDAKPSDADRLVTRRMNNVFAGTSTPLLGSSVVTPKDIGVIAVGQSSSRYADLEAYVEPDAMTPQRRKRETPLLERTQQRLNSKPRWSVISPDSAKWLADMWKDAVSQDEVGLMLFDNRHRLLAVTAIPRRHAASVKNPIPDSGAAVVMRAVAERNAAAVIPFGTNEDAVTNVAGFLSAADVRAIDGLVTDGPSGTTTSLMTTTRWPPEAYAARAWHGSPYRFTKFDLTKIGSGEGNQAYGWGLYFSRVRGVAESYRDSLSKMIAGHFVKDGKRVTKRDIWKMQSTAPNELRDFLGRPEIAKALENGNRDKFLALVDAEATGQQKQASRFRERAEDSRNRPPLAATYTPEDYDRMAAWAQARADAALQFKAQLQYRVAESSGALYEVDIPDSAIEAMLDWEAPLAQQTDAVKNVARELLKSTGYLRPDENGPRQLLAAWRSYAMERGGMADGDRGSTLYLALMRQMAPAEPPSPDGVPRGWGAAYRGDEGAPVASKHLASLGIPGIRYRGGSSGAGNVVVFDEALVTIRAINGEPPVTGPDREELLASVSPPAAARRRSVTSTPAFREWFGTSKVVDADGEPAVVYHGTARPDRVGTRFRKDRATAGPMSYFTDEPTVASNYAIGKEDTSLADTANYGEWFKVKLKGTRTPRPLPALWWDLTPEQRATVIDRMPRIGYQDPDNGTGPIVLHDDDNGIASRDHYEWTLREKRGNALDALVDVWLDSGAMFGEEEKFLDVLKAAGIDTGRVNYEHPNASYSAVYPVFLRITKPFDTRDDAARPEIRRALEDAARRKRAPRDAGMYPWDKRNVGPAEWLDKLNADMRDGTTYAWTVVPDWVTDTLKRLGFDGIKDTGGKNGGPGHVVWIPFEENQVKSATGNRGTFRSDSNDILASRPRQTPRPITGPDGRPLVMYHGSPQEFESFKAGRVDSIFFTPDREYARSYGRNVKRVTLAARKLADLTDPGSEAYALAVQTFNNNGGWPAANADYWEDARDAGRTNPTFDPAQDLTFELYDLPDTGVAEALAAAGYDVTKLQERDGIDSYAVTDPELITVDGEPLASRMNREAAGPTVQQQPLPMGGGGDGPGYQGQRPERVQAGGGDYSLRQYGSLTDQEVRTLAGVIESMDAPIEAQRRGERGWDVTEQAALNMVRNQLGITLESLVARAPGSTANAEQLEAYGIIVANATRQVQELATRAALTNSNEDLLALQAAKEKLGMLVAPAMGFRTEAGRALNILKKISASNQTAEGLLAEMGDGSTQALRDFAKRVANADNLDQVIGVTRAAYAPTWWDKFYEYWINGLLSGPTTHAVNVVSNGMYRVLEESAALVGAATSRDYSTRQVAARLAAIPHGVMLGLKNAGRAFVTEEGQLDPADKIEAARQRAIGGLAGKVIRVPGRLLRSEDEFFKAIAYNAELADIAMGEALREAPGDPMPAFHRIMGDIMNRPEAVKRARDAARRATFTQPLGNLGQLGTFYLNKSKVGRLIVPFVRTPANILKAAIDYTPAGIAREETRNMLRAGGRDAAIARGRMLIGSTVMVATVSLAAQGILSGAGPDDPEERQLLERTGWQPYSVKVGGSWVRYNRFEPLGMLMGVAADMYELGRYVTAGELERIPALLISSLALNLGDKTFLRGVTDFAEAYTNPERKAASWAQNMAASVIPVAAGQVARASDPYLREARTLTDKVRERIPVAREQLARRVDIAGQPMTQKQVGLGIPIQASAQQDDPLAEAMLRLHLPKRKPDRRIYGAELTDGEYESLATFMGQARWNVLTPMVSSPQFKALMAGNPEAARAILNRQFDMVSDQARKAWLIRNPTVLSKGLTERSRPRAIGVDYLPQR